FGEPDDHEAEPVLSGLVVLLDQAALLERGEQPRGGRLVEPETARQFGDTGFALALAEREEERRRPVDRADGVAVEDHPARPVQDWPPRAPNPMLRCVAPSPWTRASSAASSDSAKIETTRSTMSPSACASHMNHGSRAARLGRAPRGGPPPPAAR